MTPEDWLNQLEADLKAQQKRIKLPGDYYDGNHRLAFATAKFREAFGALFSAFADNWCPIVVDAPVERLQVTGFHFGTTSKDDAKADPQNDAKADTDAWAIWQRNNLDVASSMLHTEAIKLGVAYTLVDPTDPENPRITVEHPSQVIVALGSGDATARLAALKKWIGDDGHAYANIYLPDEVVKFVSKSPLPSDAGSAASDQKIVWVRRSDDPGGPHTLNAVPIIPFFNNPSMLGGGRSDLDVAIPLQDAITKQVLDLMISSEFQAFRQRVITGMEIPKDPETGQPLMNAQELKSVQSRLWVFEDPATKVTELSQADLTAYVKPIEMLIQHLAAQTRTPPHYLLASMVNVSGDALAAAESGLVNRVKKKILDFSDPWEETIRLAFRARNDPRGEAWEAETLWQDPERQSFAQLIDGAVKLRSGLGLPLDTVLGTMGEKVGITAQEQKRVAALPGAKDLARIGNTGDPALTTADLNASGATTPPYTNS